MPPGHPRPHSTIFFFLKRQSDLPLPDNAHIYFFFWSGRETLLFTFSSLLGFTCLFLISTVFAHSASAQDFAMAVTLPGKYSSRRPLTFSCSASMPCSNLTLSETLTLMKGESKHRVGITDDNGRV